MVKYNKYLAYVIRHKFFVFQECAKMGLIWQGLTHDLSKLLPDEFIPYAKYFNGDHPPKNTAGYFHKPNMDKAFDLAWNNHLKRNKHHWQWYVLYEDCGKTKVLEMPIKYRKEMLADWIGASAAQGKGKTLEAVRTWYNTNSEKMVFGTETKQWIEHKLGIIT